MADDEQKLIREQNRGIKAKELIENELLVDAFDDIKSSLVETWEASGPNDGPMREDAWRSLRLLKKLRGVLEGHVETGTLAAKQLLDVREKTRNPFNRR